jgi:hypothetical protein
MPRILFLHGLGGNPNGLKVSALRAKFGPDNVRAVNFPFSDERLSQFASEALFQGFQHARAQIAGMGVDSERLAREACDAHRPDVLIGSSLGGALAMQLAADRRLPAVLLTPVWNTQIRGDYLQHFLKRLPALQKYEHLVPLFAPLVLLWVQHFTGFRFCTSVQPRTIIFHAPEDELFDLRQSVKLLADNPLAPGDPETAFMSEVMATLGRRGFATDGRLVKVGADHQMDDPEVLRGLVEAVNLLCGAEEATKQ